VDDISKSYGWDKNFTEELLKRWDENQNTETIR
jgi:hypothetical protein